MPIKAENMSKYPGGSIKSPEWLAIREQVRERAGDCCENCEIANHSIGIRHGDDFCVAPPGELGGITTVEWDGVEVTGKVIQIVCTVAHVDNDLVDHSLHNLRFWCQRCHLRHDAAMRRAKSRRLGLLMGVA